jgi:hypothetical protein
MEPGMNQKKECILIAVAVAFIVIAATILFSGIIEKKNSYDDTKVNEDVIQIKNFNVNSESSGVNTSAKGTIFVKGAGGVPEHVQIVALIDIDPDDWGGVAFDIPAGWQISGITSSYPENNSIAAPADYITTWTTADSDYEWNSRIEVGRDRGYTQTISGSGTVVIELVPIDDEIAGTETFNIMVEVGSEEKDGVKICGTDFVEIPVSLNEIG